MTTDSMTTSMTTHSMPASMTTHSMTTHSMPASMTTHSMTTSMTTHSMPASMTAHSMTTHSMTTSMTTHSMTAYSMTTDSMTTHSRQLCHLPGAPVLQPRVCTAALGVCLYLPAYRSHCTCYRYCCSLLSTVAVEGELEGASVQCRNPYSVARQCRNQDSYSGCGLYTLP